MRILLWNRKEDSALYGFWRLLSEINGWELKDCCDFDGMSFESQQDFEQVCIEFRPDCIGLCNICRYQLPVMIEANIPVFTYQDMPIFTFLIGDAYFNRLGKNDYLIIPFDNYKTVLDVDRDVIVNDDNVLAFTFVPFVVRHDDVDVGESEIVIVRQAREIANYRFHLALQDSFCYTDAIWETICSLIRMIDDTIDSSKGNIQDFLWVNRIIEESLKKSGLYDICRDKDGIVRVWRYDLHNYILQTIYGNKVIDWICKAGYNVRLWGNGLKENKKYARFAGGVIPEGSDAVIDLYRHSKISINVNLGFPIHRRLFEAIRGNCMTIHTGIRAYEKMGNYNTAFIDGESIVYSWDRDDLFRKLDYYLEHDMERERIVRNARKTVDENHLHAEEVLRSVGERICAKIKGRK